MLNYFCEIPIRCYKTTRDNYLTYSMHNIFLNCCHNIQLIFQKMFGTIFEVIFLKTFMLYHNNST